MTGSGMRPLDLPCGEQGKQPTAKAFKLAERDINMSEQKRPSFMEELDQWTESTIIGPLFASETDGKDWEPAIERVKKAVRQKVLESYRNGQVAGPRRVAKEPQPEPQPAWQKGRR
jgi:hypothetical protein